MRYAKCPHAQGCWGLERHVSPVILLLNNKELIKIEICLIYTLWPIHCTPWQNHSLNRGSICSTKYASKFGKLSSGHRAVKGQFSFQSQRKQCKEYTNYCTIALVSHTSKRMLRIFQVRLQQFINQELPDVQVGFRKGSGTRDQTANNHWIIEKAREFQKNTYFCFIDYAKNFDCVDHKKLWRILQEMGIPDHLICLLRNVYAGQGATVRTEHGTMDWFQTGKLVHQAVYCHLLPWWLRA